MTMSHESASSRLDVVSISVFTPGTERRRVSTLERTKILAELQQTDEPAPDEARASKAELDRAASRKSRLSCHRCYRTKNI